MLNIEEKRAMIVMEDVDISVRRQCALLKLNRSSLYYEPVPVKAEDLALMNAIDEEYTKKPCLGSRQMKWRLWDRGYDVGRKRIQRLMRKMGIAGVVPTKNTSKRNPQHKVYPYLLRNVEIARVNQVWSMDITYIPLKHGFVYLTAVVDWYSRYVVAWKLSNTLSADFCVECLKEALRYGTPEIFNTDQGSQFTSEAFTKVLLDAKITISMDGRGRALDNIFIERLWRTVKYEDIYLKGYETIPETQVGLKEFFDDYNMVRRHSSLKYNTPWSIFSGLKMMVPKRMVAQAI